MSAFANRGCLFQNTHSHPSHSKCCIMNLHEYQAKRLFAAYDIPVPNGRPATTPDAAAAAARELGGSLWVVKAQVHAGGRVKAGGVKLCRSHDEVRAAAAALLGRRLTTHQTGPAGLPINT